MFHHQKFPKNAFCKNALLNSTSFSPLSYWRKLLDVSEQLSASKQSKKRPRKYKLKAEVSITPLLAALLAACSDTNNVPVGGTLDGTNVTTPDTVTPTALPFNLYVLDGAAEGALVYVDENDNGAMDDNESLIGTTDENGRVSIEAEYAGETFFIDASGALDLFTGESLPSDTFYRAISDERGGTDVVASPISTIVQALRESDETLTDTQILAIIFGANTQIDMDDLNNPNNYILPVDGGDKPIASPAARAEEIASTSIRLQALIEQHGGDLAAVLAAIGASFDVSDLNTTFQGIAVARIAEARERAGGEPIANPVTGTTATLNNDLTLEVDVWGFRDPVGNVDGDIPSEFARLDIVSITDGSGVLVHIADDDIETEYGAGEGIEFEHLGNLFFRPATDYSGRVEIIYTVFDGEDDSDEASLEIEVISDPNAPVFTSDGSPPNQDENIAANNSEDTQANAIEVYDAEIETNPLHGTSLSYSLLATDDGNSFGINASTGIVWFRAPPDHENKSSYSFTVVASVTADGVTHSASLIITLSVTDLNDNAPVFTSSATASVNENIAANDSEDTQGSAVAFYTAIAVPDVEGAAVVYSLGGADSASFGIDAGSGIVWFRAPPDHENKSSYSFTVVASVTADGVTHSASQIITLSVTDLNDNAPVFTSSATASVNENIAANDSEDTQGSAMAFYTAIAVPDVEGAAVVYSLGGADSASFGIDAGSGEVWFLESPDHENGDTSYSFTVTATVGDLSSEEQTVTVNITDLNDSPPIFADTSDAEPITVNEDVAVNDADTQGSAATIYTAIATPDRSSDSVMYSLASADTTTFGIDSSNGDVWFKTAPVFDANDPTYSFTVTATVGDLSSEEQTVTVNINDVNDAPTADTTATNYNVLGAVTEDTVLTASGEFIATDDDGDTLSYSIQSSPAGNYGTLTLGTNGQWSYTLDNTNTAVQALAGGASETDTFTLRVEDGNGGVLNQDVTITITGTNDAPTIVSGGSARGEVTEDAVDATATGAFQATDVDSDDAALSYSAGGVNYGTVTFADGNWTYTLDNTNTTVQALGMGATRLVVIALRATDSDGASTTGFTVIITIRGVDDVPTADTTHADYDVTGTYESGDIEAASGRWVVEDADVRDTLIYSVQAQGTYGTLRFGTDGNWGYAIDTTSTAIQDLDNSTTLTDTITVRAIDEAGEFVDGTVTVTINDATNTSYVNGTSGDDGTNSNYVGTSSSATEQIVQGGDGTDYLQGGTVDDIIIGGAGNDTISLNHGGNDRVIYRIASTDGGLVGSDGNDTIDNFNFTGPGIDRLVFVDTDDTPLGIFADLLTLGAGNNPQLTVSLIPQTGGNGYSGMVFTFLGDTTTPNDDVTLTLNFKDTLIASVANSIFGGNSITSNQLNDAGFVSFSTTYGATYDVVALEEFGLDII